MLLSIGITLCSGLLSAASPAELARRIIRYEARENGGVRDPRFLAFFTPAMRRAIERDGAGAEIGVLNYDPLCQCQDNEGLRMRLVSVKVRASMGTVLIESGSAATRTRVRLLVRRIGREWRVADVATAELPSLAAALKAR